MVKNFLHTLLDLYVRSHVARHPGQIRHIEDLEGKPKRFLVISSTALGDTLLSTPAIRSLRKSFPDARISLLVHKNVAPLMAGLPHIDAMILYHGGYRRFWSTLAEIRRERPEAVLIFHGNGPQDIAFGVLSGARYILKHPTSSPHRRYLSFNFEPVRQHTIEERLDMVRKIGGRCIEREMEVPFPEDSKKAGKVAGLVGAEGDVVGFQIGAANIYKMWPIDRFIELARRILAVSPGTRIVLTGNANESRLAQRIADACGDRVINSCGMFQIDELPYLLSRFRLLVTNDTGTLHLAIALKVPTISLFSATDSVLIGPYQDKEIHRVIQKDGSFVTRFPKKERNAQAMELISVDEVFAAYEDSLHN